MDWKYYNHAMIPTTAPHKLPDITPIDNGIVWKNRGGGNTIVSKMEYGF